MKAQWLALQQNEVVPALQEGGEVGIYVLNMFYPDFDTLDQGPPAAHMMGPEESAEIFRAGAGLIAPLGQYIHRYVAEVSIH